MRLFIGRVYAAFDAGGAILPTMYVIVNRELRQIVQEFETREEARFFELVTEVREALHAGGVDPVGPDA